MITTDDMLQAYYDCRKRKRRTASAVVYEMDYEARLIALRDRINTRQYAPGKSICFVVTRPRHREVFAASFEDRIVHHYIALRLEPLFEQIFSPRTFNCRKGKGQLYGVKMLERDLRQVRHCICSINSYLGLLRQCNEYGKRVEIIGMIKPQAWQYIYVKGHYEVVCLRNQYKQKTITLKRIRDGDYG